MEKYAKEESQYYEPAEVEDEQPSGRGRGRGGRGGYRGGRGGASRGRGRGGFGGYQERNEFEGEDDDDILYSAPTKVNQKPKQKKADLKMDEDNYPAL